MASTRLAADMQVTVKIHEIRRCDAREEVTSVGPRGDGIVDDPAQAQPVFRHCPGLRPPCRLCVHALLALASPSFEFLHACLPDDVAGCALHIECACSHDTKQTHTLRSRVQVGAPDAAGHRQPSPHPWRKWRRRRRFIIIAC